MRTFLPAAALLLATLAPCQQEGSSGGGPKAVESEQGQYARQSITHPGILWVRSKAKAASSGQVAEIRDEIRAALRLPRFDDNPLPPETVQAFEAATSQLSPDDSSVTASIDRILAPRIQQDLKALALERAARLRSEFQKNSMVADKTKTVDITGEQMLSVLNAAWFYLPVLEDITLVSGPESSSATVSMSLRWYHLRADSSGTPRAELVQVLHATGFMVSRRGVFGNPRDFCIRSAASTCVRQLVKETREIPAFSLSGQVTESDFLGCGLDVGSDAGVRINDRYRLVENLQGKDGSVQTEEVGWVRVSGHADTVKHRPTWARTVSGSPYEGLLLREIPLSVWSVSGGYHRQELELTSVGTKSGTASGTVQGLRLDAWYVPNLWYGLALGVGADVLSGTLTGAFGKAPASVGQDLSGLRLQVRQSVPVYRRLSLYGQGAFCLRALGTTLESPTSQQTESFRNVGVAAEGGAELAFLPSLDLRAGAGISTLNQDLSGTATAASLGSTSLGLRGKGMTFSVQLEWTPPTLGFDPLDIVLGML